MGDVSLFAASNGSAFVWVVYAILLVAAIAAVWRVFEKAGEAGWKCLIPLYNSYTLFRIAGRNGWGFLLLLIPLVNIVVALVISVDLAKHFGKSAGFGVVALFLFSLVGYLMLGYGDAEYVGTKHA
jgi:hypothetical protein